jgi:hypothetical protein
MRSLQPVHRREVPGYGSGVTGGWQGGGWGPQQDPYGGQSGQYGGQSGQWGVDPYAGGDPYGQQQPQYGADPYGQQPQYGADPYGQQQFGGYPGYPQPGFEPPKRSKLPIILSLVAILAVVGTVVTIVLLNRDGGEPAAAPTATSSPSRPPSTPKDPPASTSRKLPTSGSAPPSKPGWITIDVGVGSYQVPQEWNRNSQPRPSGLGVDFTRGAVVGEYQCENNVYFRGFAAFGEAQSKDGSELDLNKTITDFASSFAKEYYGGNPALEVGAPKEAKAGAATGATLTVKLTVTPTKPACEATGGEVAIVGVPIDKDGEKTGVRMLVVVNDLAGGPADPPGLPDELAEEILGTFTLN